MNFKDYKFPCTEVPNLLGSAKGSTLPTPKQVEKALNVLNKEYLLGITKTDTNDLISVIQKYNDYSPNKMSGSLMRYLCEIYTVEVLGIMPIVKFSELSTRSYQINGTKNESVAIDILSRVDGISYEKNTKMFENEYFIGRPDILHKNTLKEIKTVANYNQFLYIFNSKPNRDDQYQMQCYMDLVDAPEGELIYVATGIHPDEYVKYIQFAKKFYEDAGFDEKKVNKKLKTLEKSCRLDGMEDLKKVKRFVFKKNPEMIRFAKKKVTFARNELIKIDEKYNKAVVLQE